MPHEKIIKSVRKWVETLVVGLNLCPFAKRELVNNRIRFYVSEATTQEQLLEDLQTELKFLSDDKTIETTLLIHPQVLEDFCDYNEFLDYADGLIIQMELEGIFQIASFHPDYQFSGTKPNDVENYSNRSPYPLLHLIREQSLERAIANYPNVELIPERNIGVMQSLGKEKLQAMFQSYFDNTEK